MSHKRVRWWVALLLPGLVLRSLIPLGFMPMFGPAYGVALVLCAGYAPVLGTTASMSMEMPMDAPMDGQPGTPDHQDHQDHSTCPYGASPALGGLPTLGILLVTAAPAAELAVPRRKLRISKSLLARSPPRGTARLISDSFALLNRSVARERAAGYRPSPPSLLSLNSLGDSYVDRLSWAGSGVGSTHFCLLFAGAVVVSADLRRRRG